MSMQSPMLNFAWASVNVSSALRCPLQVTPISRMRYPGPNGSGCTNAKSKYVPLRRVSGLTSRTRAVSLRMERNDLLWRRVYTKKQLTPVMQRPAKCKFAIRLRERCHVQTHQWNDDGRLNRILVTEAGMSVNKWSFFILFSNASLHANKTFSRSTGVGFSSTIIDSSPAIILI